MLNNLQVSLGAVLPLLALILIGFILGKKQRISDQSATQINSCVFRLFLPIMLFCNVYQSETHHLANGSLLLFAISATLMSVLLTALIFKIAAKDRMQRAALIQGAFRSNFVIYGTPVVTSLYGSEALGTVSVLIAVIVPIYNVTSVLILCGQGQRSERMKQIIANPLIIGTALGFAVKLTGLALPEILLRVLDMLGSLATPLALLILGASCKKERADQRERRLTNMAAAVKLVVLPVLFLPAAIIWGLRDAELASVMVMLGAPTAISAFTMAKELQAGEELTRRIVIMTTVLSIFSIFVLTFFLKTFQYM